MSVPPSFEPKKRRPRPSAAGAKSVGRALPDAERQAQPQSQPRRDAQPAHSTQPEHKPAAGFSGTRRPSSPVRRSAFETRASRPSAPQERWNRYKESSAHGPKEPSVQQPVVDPRAQRQVADPRATRNEPRATPDQSASETPRSYQPAVTRPRPQQDAYRTSTPRQPWSRRKKLVAVAMVPALLLVTVLGWGIYLYSYGNSRLVHVEALSGAADTPGDTYLIVGSDERHGEAKKSIQGMRADTIMLLNVPESGSPALISLPRDTLVTYADGSGQGKLNAALNYGGPKALVETVEQLSGLTIDRYIMIGMDGVAMLTDAVGGINLCYDRDVNDSYSDLVWTAGCHDVDGTVALQFSRMRYADPLGDIGRGQRQRQVVSKVLKKALSPGVILNPVKQHELAGAVADVVTVDSDATLFSVAMAGLDLRKVMGSEGVNGAPPIADLNYYAGGVSYVLLDESRIAQFWKDLREGTLTEDSFASF